MLSLSADFSTRQRIDSASLGRALGGRKKADFGSSASSALPSMARDEKSIQRPAYTISEDLTKSPPAQSVPQKGRPGPLRISRALGGGTKNHGHDASERRRDSSSSANRHDELDLAGETENNSLMETIRVPLEDVTVVLENIWRIQKSTHCKIYPPAVEVPIQAYAQGQSSPLFGLFGSLPVIENAKEAIRDLVVCSPQECLTSLLLT